MLSSTTIKAFKMLHWVATFTMAIVIAGYCYFQHIQRLTVSDKLYEVRQLTPRTWLYITEYDGSNMTTGEVYRYFLASKIEAIRWRLSKNNISPQRLPRTPPVRKLTA